MDKLLKHALNYHKNGFKVIFTAKNKKPVCSWGKYRERQSKSDIEQMYNSNVSKIHGLAVICVDGVEVIDIDAKYCIQIVNLIQII